MRNSLLVKWFCAENVTGLKLITEAADFSSNRRVVGERSMLGEAVAKAAVDGMEVRMPV